MKNFLALSPLLFLLLCLGVEARAEPYVAPNCMVATVNPIATDAGVEVLRDGGNAVDAAVAAAVMLGVVDSHNSGLGGGCLILIRRANGEVVAIDGREMAPAAAHRDMYVVDAEVRADLSQDGPLAAAVPGALAAYAIAVEEFGQRPLKPSMLRAAKVAEDGFVLRRPNARVLKAKAELISDYPATAAVLLKPDGTAPKEGETLRQPDLAKTYRSIAEGGRKWFYEGPFAETVGDWMAKNGGIMTAADFAAYKAVRREPIVSKYRGHTVYGFPPPSSGGVHVAQMLNMLAQFDLAEIHQRDPGEAAHVIVESMKLAFADRAYWLGDADFAKVPRGLLDLEYAKELAGKIDPDRSVSAPGHGNPPYWESSHLGGHTTHITAVDAEGNWVAITATVNTSFGCKVIVPGTGLVLNNEMDDFSRQPGVPNAFGLIGAENNAIEPGKRPLSSMSPTIVLDPQGEPLLTVGAAGGPKIITQVLLTIIRYLDYGMDLADAVAAPRFHHQWQPDRVVVERALTADVAVGICNRGHNVHVIRAGGVSQAIGRLPDGELIGVHDPRMPGKAAGF